MRDDRAGPFFVHTMNAFARSTQFPATPRINCAPSRNYDAVVADSRELSGGESLLGAIERLRHPVRLLLAPRGLLNEVPPLYPEAVLEHWRERQPQIAMSTVADVNHYTIVMHERGIGHVADAVREALNQT